MSTVTGVNSSGEIPQLDLSPESLPLTTNEFGVVRITGTRIGLDVLVEAYRLHGRTPDQIAYDYRLKLGIVYTLIGFYLRRKPEVDEYINGLYRHAENTFAELEAKGLSSPDWYEKLLTRKEAHQSRRQEPS